MPEGHTIHRLAGALAELYGGQRLRVSSPQGRFTDGAARLDGGVLLGARAHGKHLFLAFGPQPGMPLDDEAVTPPPSPPPEPAVVTLDVTETLT